MLKDSLDITYTYNISIYYIEILKNKTCSYENNFF